MKPESTSKDRQEETESPNCCPICDSTELEESVAGIDTICSQCGLVISAFDSVGDSDELDAYLRGTNDDLQEEESWLEYCSVTNKTEKRVAVSLGILEEYADALEISIETRLRASQLFAEAAKRNLTDGRATENVIGAMLYLAARETGEVRPLSIVAELTSSTGASMEQFVRLFQIELDLEHSGCHPVDYLSFLCDEFGYKEPIHQCARQILAEAREHELANGKNPVGMAGAAVYCASGRSHSQQAIANAAGISKETIRVRLAELREEGIVDD